MTSRRGGGQPGHDDAPARRPEVDSRVRRYGRTDAVQITEVICLWYGSFRSQTVRVIVVRDDKPRTRERDDRGYGLPLVPLRTTLGLRPHRTSAT
jgi:hypothetical protein